MLLLTSYFLLLTSYFLLLTSYFLLLTKLFYAIKKDCRKDSPLYLKLTGKAIQAYPTIRFHHCQLELNQSNQDGHRNHVNSKSYHLSS